MILNYDLTHSFVSKVKLTRKFFIICFELDLFDLFSCRWSIAWFSSTDKRTTRLCRFCTTHAFCHISLCSLTVSSCRRNEKCTCSVQTKTGFDEKKSSWYPLDYREGSVDIWSRSVVTIDRMIWIRIYWTWNAFLISLIVFYHENCHVSVHDHHFSVNDKSRRIW